MPGDSSLKCSYLNLMKHSHTETIETLFKPSAQWITLYVSIVFAFLDTEGQI